MTAIKTGATRSGQVASIYEADGRYLFVTPDPTNEGYWLQAADPSLELVERYAAAKGLRIDWTRDSQR